MYIKKIILVIALLILHSVTGLAQTNFRLRGTLIDESKNPVAYATVQWLSLPDSAFVAGAISDREGRFSLESNKPLGNSCVEISFVGYRTEIISPIKSDLGIITLHTDDNMLKDVVVTARKPSYKLDGSSIITTVRNTILSDVGDANDVMRYLPGVQVTGMVDPKIEVLGSGEPVIYINNRLVRNKSELKQLKSRDIEKIEVDTDPGAEYSSGTGAVIRIKTVAKQGDGLSGSAEVQAGWMDHVVHGEDVALNYRRKGLDVFGNVSYVKNYSKGTGDNMMSVYTDPQWSTYSKVDARNNLPATSANIGVNYTINSKHSIGAQYRYTKSERLEDRFATQERYIEGELSDRLETDALNETAGDNHYVNAYYAGKLAKNLTADFNFDFLSNNSDADQTLDERGLDGTSSRKVTSRSTSDNRLYAAKLILSYQKGKGLFRFGGEYTDIGRDNLYISNLDDVPDSDTRTTERKAAAFVNYALKFGKGAQLQAGLRYEHTESSYYVGALKSDDQSRIYDNLFPNLSLSFPIGKKASMSMSYSQSMQRPSFSQLNGSVHYFDRFLLSSGDPLLKPTVQHSVTWRTLYKFLVLSVSYKYTKDAILSDWEVYGDDHLQLMGKYINHDSKQMVTVTLSGNPIIGCWRPMFNLYYEQQFIALMTPFGLDHLNDPYFRGSLNNLFSLPKEFTLIAGVTFKSQGFVRSNEYRESTWTTQFGVQKTFLNKALRVELGVSDPFKTERFNFTKYNRVSTQVATNYVNSRLFIAKVAYFFNQTKSKYKGKGAAGDDMNRLD